MVCQLNSENVLERIGSLFRPRGILIYIRSNDGPEFSATAVNDWLSPLGVGPLFIQPGAPW